MRKYFTWRCIGLHLLVVVLVPTFLLAGWWQYHVALGGNTLSWVYTVEWPFFAGYALYVWWKMIHDQTTLVDRLWTAKQRAAADAEGRPLHEIPGWAMDKALSKEVIQASLDAARLQLLPGAPTDALESPRHETVIGVWPRTDGGLPPELTEVAASAEPPDGHAEPRDDDATIIDARVLDVKAVVDEDLDAYNRYLAELSWKDAPKQWRSPRRRGRKGAAAASEDAGGGSSVPTARSD